MIEAIGYLATVLNVAGNLMLTRKNVWGWIVRLLVNVLYIIYAVQVEGGGPMWVNHAIFIVINIEGWRKWRQLEQYEHCLVCQELEPACECTGGPTTQWDCACIESWAGHQPGCAYAKQKGP